MSPRYWPGPVMGVQRPAAKLATAAAAHAYNAGVAAARRYEWMQYARDAARAGDLDLAACRVAGARNRNRELVESLRYMRAAMGAL